VFWYIYLKDFHNNWLVKALLFTGMQFYITLMRLNFEFAYGGNAWRKFYVPDF